MKIKKRDILIIILGAAAGFIIMFVAGAGHPLGQRLIGALLVGASSGAGGGVVACIFRRLIGRRRKT